LGGAAFQLCDKCEQRPTKTVILSGAGRGSPPSCAVEGPHAPQSRQRHIEEFSVPIRMAVFLFTVHPGEAESIARAGLLKELCICGLPKPRAKFGF